MKVDKRANFCIFFVIAILALGLSNFAAAYTGDLVSNSFPGINETDKMIALDNDNFTPLSVNAVYEKKVVEEVNETENETDTNSTEDEDVDDDDSDDKKKHHENDNNNENNNNNNNNNNNQNTDSDTDDNGGGDNSDSTPSHDQTDDSDEE